MKHSNGFTLLETMIALSIGSIIIYSLMSVNNQITTTQSRMLDLMDIQDLMAQVRFTFNDSLACNKTIAKEYSKPNTDPDKPDEVWLKAKGELFELLNQKERTVIEVGGSYNRLNILKMYYEFEDVNDVDENTGGVAILKLFIQIKGKNKKSVQRNQSISFAAAFDKSKGDDAEREFLFSSCDSMTSSIAAEVVTETTKKLCASLGVPYNPLNGQCDMASFGGQLGNLIKGNGGDIQETQKALIEQIMKA